MPSGRTHRSLHGGLHAVTNASIVVQSTQPNSGLHIERSMKNVAKTTTSRWCGKDNYFKVVWQRQLLQGGVHVITKETGELVTQDAE